MDLFTIPSAFTAKRRKLSPPINEREVPENLEGAAEGDTSQIGGGPSLIDGNDVTKSCSKTASSTSNFTETDTNVIWENKKPRPTQIITLRSGDTLLIAGQYQLRVRTGLIKLYGALLRGGSPWFTISAPFSHSVAPVSLPTGDSSSYSLIEIRAVYNGLDKLQEIVEHHELLWTGATADSATRICGISYCLVNDRTSTRFPCPVIQLDIPRDWTKLISSLVSHHDSSQLSNQFAPALRPSEINGASSRQENVDSSILVCGPKGAGKSTFVRILCNHILSRSGDEEVFLLDLDPGQPEFTTPGHISLIKILKPSFGPPFTHVLSPASEEVSSLATVLKSIFFGSITPKAYVHRYFECSKELYTSFRNLKLEKKSKLVVNCSSWLDDSGMEFQEALIRLVRPNHVVAIGSNEPLSSLLASITSSEMEVHQLSSRAVLPGNRTSSQLRSMQTSTYFHNSTPGPENPVYILKPILSQRGFRLQLHHGKLPRLEFAAFAPSLPFPADHKRVMRLLEASVVSILKVNELHGVGADQKPLTSFGCGCNECTKIWCDMPLAKNSESVGQGVITQVDTVGSNWLELYTPVPLEYLISKQEKVGLCVGEIDPPGWLYKERALYALQEKQTPSKGARNIALPETSKLLAYRLHQHISATESYASVRPANSRAGEGPLRVRRNLIAR